jgi:endoglucanase
MGLQTQIQPPLHAQLMPGAGNATLLDDHNRAVKLVSVNWYGAESPDLVPGGLDKQSPERIAQEIKKLGFNSVRLPFSNYMVECNPVVESAFVSKLAAGPTHALEVYDQVVAALANQGLMVILDDHSSDATWSPDPNNALWYNSRYSTDQWIMDWIAMAQRYRGVPTVIGVDLRNEPTGQAQWGTGGTEFDWREAAERAGNALLSSSGNPHLLVMVEGIELGVNLAGVQHDPICLQPGQASAYSGPGPCPPASASSSVVYAPHDYESSQPANVNKSYKDLSNQLGNVYGWNAAAVAAPLWIGEFGTCNTSPQCVRADAKTVPGAKCLNSSSGPLGTWFANFTDFVAQANLSWAYWPLNGTQSTGGPHTNPARSHGSVECYGLLDKEWAKPAPMAADLVCALQAMINPSAAPYPANGCSQQTPPPSVPQTGGAVTSTRPTTPTLPTPSCGPSPCGGTNGVTVIITSVTRSPTNYSGEDLTSKGQFFVRMGVRVKNSGPQTITINNAHFALEDSDHLVDSTSDEGYESKCGLSGNGDPGLTLAPGADVTMPESLCFEPHGSLHSSFIVALGLDGGGQVDVPVH